MVFYAAKSIADVILHFLRIHVLLACATPCFGSHDSLKITNLIYRGLTCRITEKLVLKSDESMADVIFYVFGNFLPLN